jgi:uncharacterized membrane protein
MTTSRLEAFTDAVLALGHDWKARISALIYVSGVAIAFVNSALAMVPYAVVPLLWLVPDQRVERALDRAGTRHANPPPDDQPAN